MGESAVGVVGLGKVRRRIARCLRGAGFDALGFDLDEAKARESGLDVASSAAEEADRAATIVLPLPDSRAVEAALLGDGGVAEHVREGQMIVDLTTASPESTRHIHGVVRPLGVGFADCRISGGAALAEKGQLPLMVGGDKADFDRLQPVLAGFSANAAYMGPSGFGHTAKLLNNFLNAVTLAATSEVMVAARRRTWTSTSSWKSRVRAAA